MFRQLNSFTSTFLLFFLLIIFVITVGNEIFITKSLKSYSEYDAKLINDLGKIRGGIQRYTKLKLYHKNVSEIEKQIDDILKKIDTYTSKYDVIPSKYSVEFYNLLLSTKNYWEKLKNTNSPDKLIILSEKAWKVADKLTNLMTKISNYHFSKLKRIVLIFTITTTLIIIVLLILVIYYVKKGLEKATITDPLTKLYNRMFFDIQYNYFINKFKRKQTPFSAFIFDIDNFKQINDNFGHATGDKILKDISEIIKKTIRNTDLAFRYGGEEFIVLFPETKADEAHKIAQRLKEEIANIKINNKKITISGGVGEFKEKYSKDFFLNEIDKALYFAKNSGKDKIVPIT